MPSMPSETPSLAELAQRVSALENRLELHAPTLARHHSRLDEHERQLADLRAAQLETNRHLATLTSQVSRLSDFATTQGLSLERLERMVGRILEHLEVAT